MNEMVVHTRAQLAAAIKAVPHDGPCAVTLVRPSGGRMTWRFDYSAGIPFRYSTNHGFVKRQELVHDAWRIDARLATLAARVRRTPEEAFR